MCVCDYVCVCVCVCVCIYLFIYLFIYKGVDIYFIGLLISLLPNYL